MKEKRGFDHFEERSCKGCLGRADDNDRLRLPSASASRPGEAGKNESKVGAAANPAGYPKRRHQRAIPLSGLQTMSELPNAYRALEE
jgi:hypothetical protein